jgi:hypothetical protein
MANANTQITLEELHTAIVNAIEAKYPAIPTVEFYSTIRQGMPLPACLLELTEMDSAPDKDPGTQQLAVDARFEARFIIGFRTADAKLAVRSLAGSFAAWLRYEEQRWGKPVGPAEVIGCYQDDFSPELDQFEVWRVEWTQTLHLGERVVDEGGAIPQAFYSFVPYVGLGNEEYYRALDGVTPP